MSDPTLFDIDLENEIAELPLKHVYDDFGSGLSEWVSDRLMNTGEVFD